MGGTSSSRAPGFATRHVCIAGGLKDQLMNPESIFTLGAKFLKLRNRAAFVMGEDTHLMTTNSTWAALQDSVLRKLWIAAAGAA